MNKHDIKLILIIILMSLLIIGIYRLNSTSNNLYAFIYYKDDLILKIDLAKEEEKYTIVGENGPVIIKAGNGKVMVEQENSPNHLCSKQGYISKSYESIICLPNKVVVKIKDINNEIDAIIK